MKNESPHRGLKAAGAEADHFEQSQPTASPTPHQLRSLVARAIAKASVAGEPLVAVGRVREGFNGIYAKGLASCIRTIAVAQPDDRLAVFQNMAREAAGYVRKGGIDVSEFADRFQDMAVAYGLVEAHSQDAIQAMLTDALKEPTALNADASESHHWPARSNGLRPENGSGATAALVSRCAADIAPEKIEWLWPGRLARGKHTCIAGEPGTGKSQVCISIIAAVTTGGEWPCGEGRAPLGNAIILSAEDGAADTIVPRLIAAGADLNRVHVVSAVRDADRSRRTLNLQNDLDLLERKIAEIGEVALVVVDPVSSYLGKTDSHKNSEVRGVLEPVSEMAERTRVAILSVTHFSKAGANNTTKALHRFIGSIAFTGAPRAAFAVIEDVEHDDRRLFLHAKNNLARAPQGLAFRLEQCGVGDGIVASRILWDAEPVAITANEALAADAAGTETRTAKADSIELLKAALAGGPVPAAEVNRMGREHGITTKAIRSAREALGVKIERDGFGPGSKSLWSLPEGA
jgi:KaiC/GvpD/RAD55 family RecA-like ATPase